MNILRLTFVLALAGVALAPAASAAPLRAPTGLSPASKATVAALPVFKWNAVRNAARYDFQASASRNFSSLVSGRGASVGTVKTRNTAASIDRSQPDGAYFWRVRAISRAGRAGRWSATREVLKRWDLVPQLIAPRDGDPVMFPGQPLVLRWSPVTGALKYELDVATDPSLSASVLRGRKPLETAATVHTFQGTLSPGTYYWAVTPLDSRGNRGVRSEIQSFTWTWDSTSRLDPVTDLDPRPGVFDPLLSWSPVGGAAKYEVEINASDVWAPGSKVCCDEQPIAPSLAPYKVLSNNRFFWRVRAIDSSGHVGQWNVGPAFEKVFTPGVPTIPNLALRDEDGPKDLSSGPAVVTNPIVTWDPVPGASSYKVRVVPWDGAGCNTTENSSEDWDVITASTAWTPLAASWVNRSPMGVVYRDGASRDTNKALVDGHKYCVWVIARSDRDSKGQEVISQPTELRGPNLPAFEYEAPTIDLGAALSPMQSASYGAPAAGTTTARAPYFTWQQAPRARSYYVVVARDPGFTNVVDLALTTATVYAPRAGKLPKTYADEATHYYWAVVPASEPNGDGATAGGPVQNSFQSFLKQSVPPGQIAPADGASISDQPHFRWSPAESARSYRLQVASDPTFGNLVDDVQTSSTAYTAAATYPVDTALYWRVRATDETGIGLSWSTTRSFRRSLPAPTLDPTNPTGGTVIPQLAWSRVPGAIAYDLAVDQADGSRRDFRMPTASFTPVLFYGTGVWSFRVRAVFPGKGIQTVTGPYTPRTPFARSIGVPSSATTEVRRGRMVLKWTHAPGVRSYRVELSKTTSFDRPLDFREVDGTAYAPTLDNDLLRFGKVYWRVAGIDEGNNRGAFKVGSFSAGASLKVALKGTLRRDRSSRVTLTVKDGKKVVRGARVEITGAGIRNRRARTNRRGRATFALKPRRGTVEIKVSTTDGRFGRITRRVR